MGLESGEPCRAGQAAIGALQDGARRRRGGLRGSVDQNGFAVDAAFDMKGFENTLKLRADMLNTWGGNPPPPAAKYLDLSHYQKALAGL
jgi:hypothetical protein